METGTSESLAPAASISLNLNVIDPDMITAALLARSVTAPAQQERQPPSLGLTRHSPAAFGSIPARVSQLSESPFRATPGPGPAALVSSQVANHFPSSVPASCSPRTFTSSHFGPRFGRVQTFATGCAAATCRAPSVGGLNICPTIEGSRSLRLGARAGNRRVLKINRNKVPVMMRKSTYCIESVTAHVLSRHPAAQTSFRHKYARSRNGTRRTDVRVSGQSNLWSGASVRVSPGKVRLTFFGGVAPRWRGLQKKVLSTACFLGIYKTGQCP
jgi:hypothetical protein